MAFSILRILIYVLGLVGTSLLLPLGVALWKGESAVAPAFLVLLYRPASGEAYEMPRGGTVLEADAHVVLITPAGDTRLVARFCGKE